MHSCIEIQYGGQQIVFSVRKFLPPQQDFVQKDGLKYSVFKLPLGLLYVFRKDRHCKFIFIESSSLVQFSPDKHRLDISWLVKQ